MSLFKQDIRKVNSLQQAVQEFSRKDLLTGENKYNCEFCKTKRDSAKWMEVATSNEVKSARSTNDLLEKIQYIQSEDTHFY